MQHLKQANDMLKPNKKEMTMISLDKMKIIAKAIKDGKLKMDKVNKILNRRSK